MFCEYSKTISKQQAAFCSISVLFFSSFGSLHLLIEFGCRGLPLHEKEFKIRCEGEYLG